MNLQGEEGRVDHFSIEIKASLKKNWNFVNVRNERFLLFVSSYQILQHIILRSDALVITNRRVIDVTAGGTMNGRRQRPGSMF